MPTITPVVLEVSMIPIMRLVATIDEDTQYADLICDICSAVML